MPARLNPKHDATTRLKIQTTQLINRLQACALGEVEMSRERIRAAEILLRKALPDLQSIHKTNVDTVKSQAQWLREMQELDPEGPNKEV